MRRVCETRPEQALHRCSQLRARSWPRRLLQEVSRAGCVLDERGRSWAVAWTVACVGARRSTRCRKMNAAEGDRVQSVVALNACSSISTHSCSHFSLQWRFASRLAAVCRGESIGREHCMEHTSGVECRDRGGSITLRSTFPVTTEMEEVTLHALALEQPEAHRVPRQLEAQASLSQLEAGKLL